MEKQYDLGFLKDYFNDDLESILPILHLYLEETPRELSLIESYLLKNETAAAKAATHKIKTNIAMLGIQNTGSFINDMHLLKADDKITGAHLNSFMQFKKAVNDGLEEMSRDFFSN